jgi:hypothetical protein
VCREVWSAISSTTPNGQDMIDPSHGRLVVHRLEGWSTQVAVGENARDSTAVGDGRGELHVLGDR